MIIGYARVSTTGQNLARQTDLLTQSGCERIYSEKISGVKKERPQLDRMMDSLRSGDTVIITEFTRLGRSVKELLSIIKSMHEAGASIKSLRETWLDTTTPQGNLLLTIFAGLSQFERDLTRFTPRFMTKPGLCKSGLRFCQEKSLSEELRVDYVGCA